MGVHKAQKLKKMKKQILFLAIFTLAIIFAGTSAFGQTTGDGSPTDYTTDMYLSGAPECADVTALTCVSSIDELHPQAGLPYTYSVTTAATNKVHWFVVANNNNIVVNLNDITSNIGANIDDNGLGGGNYILTSDAAYNNSATSSASTVISWKSFDGIANVVLLVAYVTDAAGCTDNIEVYRILPVFNFTLDVNAIASAGTETGLAQSSTSTECVSPIESATYTPSATPLTVPGTLVADYGENWVFFTVTAANFTHSWMPTFQFTYSGTDGEVLEAAWAYPTDAIANTTWTSIDVTTGVTAAVFNTNNNLTAVPPVVGADNGSGQCIVVRVRIDHGTIPENAVNNQTLRMAVNGFMYDQVNTVYTTALLEDIHYADTNADSKCNDTDDWDNDWVNQILTPRPQIISTTGTPDQPFETKQDNVDNLGNN